MNFSHWKSVCTKSFSTPGFYSLWKTINLYKYTKLKNLSSGWKVGWFCKDQWVCTVHVVILILFFITAFKFVHELCTICRKYNKHKKICRNISTPHAHIILYIFANVMLRAQKRLTKGHLWKTTRILCWYTLSTVLMYKYSLCVKHLTDRQDSNPWPL